jgi:molybdenum cofactor guanylyltransferase
MNRKRDAVNGYILAGGKSLRMGTDKAFLAFRGKTLIQHVIEKLSPAVDEMIVVSNNLSFLEMKTDVISDVIKDKGPAGGIHAALQHCSSSKIVVVSCDMPFINAEAIEFIIKNSSNTQITLPFHNNNLEPLFGVYSKDCFLQWEKLVQQNVLKLSDIISHFSLQKLLTDEHPVFTDAMFTNINTKDDFINAQKVDTNGN